MKKLVIILFLFFVASNFSFAQTPYVSHYILKSKIKSDTLTDKDGMKFILDKERISITAFDKNGKQIWKTDPAIDNKLEVYRVERPVIVYFELQNENRNNPDDKNEVIWIVYNNTQFGFLNKQNGKFNYGGQD